jgi:large subunit ribosomal protein L13
MLCGDAVVVINSKFAAVTGRKIKEKIYTKYTGYPGGIRKIAMDKLMNKNPSLAIRHAVKGMLPRTRLARLMLRNLKVYAETAHNQQAQAPQPIDL